MYLYCEVDSLHDCSRSTFSRTLYLWSKSSQLTTRWDGRTFRTALRILCRKGRMDAVCEKAEVLLRRKQCPGRNQEEGTAHDKCGTSHLQTADKRLVGPDSVDDKTYKELVEALQKYYNPKPTKVVQRYIFKTRFRKPGRESPWLPTSQSYVPLHSFATTGHARPDALRQTSLNAVSTMRGFSVGFSRRLVNSPSQQPTKLPSGWRQPERTSRHCREQVPEMQNLAYIK